MGYSKELYMELEQIPEREESPYPEHIKEDYGKTKKDTVRAKGSKKSI